MLFFSSFVNVVILSKFNINFFFFFLFLTGSFAFFYFFKFNISGYKKICVYFFDRSQLKGTFLFFFSIACLLALNFFLSFLLLRHSRLFPRLSNQFFCHECISLSVTEFTVVFGKFSIGFNPISAAKFFINFVTFRISGFPPRSLQNKIRIR